MELVCHEVRRKWTWYYNAELKEYVRLDDNGRMRGNITGVNLPNPNEIEAARRTAKAKGQLPIAARDCADTVTKKLWEHWCASINN